MNGGRKNMKRILIVHHAMEIGGVESALLGLLESIDPTRVSVDLFLLRHEGEMLDFIPDYIHLLPSISAYTVLGRPIMTTMKEGHILLSLARIRGKFKAVQYEKRHHLGMSAVAIEYSHKYTKMFMPAIQPDIEYDLAISFMSPHYYVAEKVRAKKKIAWIHTDYSITQIDMKSELKMWSEYDHIASISENVTDTFLSTFPSLKNKIILIENIMPMQYMSQLADEFSAKEEMPKSEVSLLTIGRFCNAKRMDEIPQICKRIRERGIDAKWYLIGFGGDEALIRQRIAEAGAEDYVIILGKKENPYPYIKACDIYVQPSRYEGKSVAVREAQILGKPVIITNYATAASQLNDGIDGVIVPMDIDACADGIIKVIKDKRLQETLIENTKKTDYTNASEINRFYDLMGE